MANIAHLFHFSLKEMGDMNVRVLLDWNDRALRFVDSADD